MQCACLWMIWCCKCLVLSYTSTVWEQHKSPWWWSSSSWRCWLLLSLLLFLASGIHTFPEHWPWTNNCFEQWSEQVFLSSWVTHPFNWSGEKAWKNSVQNRWAHSTKANHGSAHVSGSDTWKTCEYAMRLLLNKSLRVEFSLFLRERLLI